jgi:hypothetical protein
MPGPVMQDTGLRKRLALGNGNPGLGQVINAVFFQFIQAFTFVGNETLTATLAIQADADFLCGMSSYDTSMPAVGGFGAGINSLNGGSLVTLTDASSQRALSSAPVPASTLFGTAQRPFVWPYTHRFRANGGITIVTQGTTAVTAQVVRYVFSGFKIPVGTLA